MAADSESVIVEQGYANRSDETSQPAERSREQLLADEALQVAIREVRAVPRRFLWLVASPAVLGALLVIFIAVGWGLTDLIPSSGTASTALVVGSALMLVPAILSTLRGVSPAEHAQMVYDQAAEVIRRQDDR